MNVMKALESADSAMARCCEVSPSALAVLCHSRQRAAAASCNEWGGQHAQVMIYRQ